MSVKLIVARSAAEHNRLYYLYPGYTVVPVGSRVTELVVGAVFLQPGWCDDDTGRAVNERLEWLNELIVTRGVGTTRIVSALPIPPGGRTNWRTRFAHLWHNCVIHPVAGLLWFVGCERLGDRVHGG